MPKLLHRDKVLEIRSQFKAGYIIKELAEIHGLNRKTISDLVHERTYHHVQDVPHVRPATNRGRRDIDSAVRHHLL